MHLLVLSAFRHEGLNDAAIDSLFRLNAPSGAQCFPTRRRGGGRMLRSGVSMHLLVLSAFRL